MTSRSTKGRESYPGIARPARDRPQCFGRRAMPKRFPKKSYEERIMSTLCLPNLHSLQKNMKSCHMRYGGCEYDDFACRCKGMVGYIDFQSGVRENGTPVQAPNPRVHMKTISDPRKQQQQEQEQPSTRTSWNSHKQTDIVVPSAHQLAKNNGACMTQSIRWWDPDHWSPPPTDLIPPPVFHPRAGTKDG